MDVDRIVAGFSRENMTGYASKAYCAGWKAAVQACMGNPDKLDACHGAKWLADNPPAHYDMPQFAEWVPEAVRARLMGEG